MAYDAATGTVGPVRRRSATRHLFAGTWTWDGTTWTQQHPATSPPARDEASMAYDAATGTVVLFGGNGSDRHRSVTPGPGTARPGPSSTRDQPARPVRRVDGLRRGHRHRGPVRRRRHKPALLGDTWTWDGTTWTKQHPATSPPARDGRRWPTTRPPATWSCSAATASTLGDTWTWDGTTWTQQAPGDQPARPGRASMAYDAATGTVVLFGGCCSPAACSATPGPGTAPPGPSSTRRGQPLAPRTRQ